MTTRTLPMSLDAERAALGACLLGDLTVLDEVADVLGVEDFYSDSHGHVWRWMLSERDRGNTPDVLALAEHMMQGGKDRIERFGGIGYATSLPDQVPTSIGARRYAEIVHETAQRRRVVLACGQITEAVHAGEDSEALVTRARGLIEAVADNGQQASVGDVAIHEAAEEWLQDFYQQQEAIARGDTPGFSTGLHALDRHLLLQRQEFSLWAGRPAMGKSQLLMTVLRHVAEQEMARGPEGVVYLTSLEMGKKELVARWVSTFCRIPYSWLLKGKVDAQGQRAPFNRDELDRIETAHEQLWRLPIIINDRPARSIEAVRRSCLRINRDRDLVMVGLDYLQLATTEASAEEVQRLTYIADGCKALAKEIDGHVAAAAQLNRSVEGRSDKRPQMSDLRGSGGLEQAANIICGVYRDEYYNPDTTTKPGVAEVLLLKERNGQAGAIAEIGFAKGLFANLDRRHDDMARHYAHGGF